MRVGLIARADSRGLGIQTKAFHDHMHPTKTMVVNCPSANPLPLRRDWFPGAVWTRGLPSVREYTQFLDGVDVVYTAETAYGQAFWPLAQQRGVRSVLHGNYEFLDRRDQPTTWAAPSLWHIDQWPEGTIHLPVPIETERFQPDPPAAATRLLHIVGRPAVHDRNGTLDLLQALSRVTQPFTVTIRCQQAGYVGDLIAKHRIRTPDHITLILDSGDVTNYWDNYRDQDALILPRRFGGLCLPANEAVGAGIPVIMPDINPNNLWLPPEWLVTAHQTGHFHAKQRITYYRTNILALAAAIDQLADPGFYQAATSKAARLRNTLSWDALKPRYLEVLAQ